MLKERLETIKNLMGGKNSMSDKLKVYENEEITIMATYKKYVITNHRRNNLFIHITDVDGNKLAGSCWIKIPSNKAKILEPKHAYILKGTVTTCYKKNKCGNKIADYCITNITEIKEK